MTRAVVFRPQAEDELLEVQRWYEGRREGLGEEFGEAIERMVARIATGPAEFHCVRGATRRAVLNRFPYAIYFRETDSEIIEAPYDAPDRLKGRVVASFLNRPRRFRRRLAGCLRLVSRRLPGPHLCRPCIPS